MHASRCNADNVMEWVETIPEAGCWVWLGSMNKFGYGTAKGTLAHRAIYEMLVGPVDKGIDVMHLCHNRLCVNPAHLRPGTRKENVDMSVNAGRWNKPLRSKIRKAYMAKHSVNGIFPGRSAKFSEAQVKAIRNRMDNGELAKVIAAEHGVTRNAIYAIHKRKVYKYV